MLIGENGLSQRHTQNLYVRWQSLFGYVAYLLADTLQMARG